LRLRFFNQIITPIQAFLKIVGLHRHPDQNDVQLCSQHTFANYPIEFVGSPLNSAFAVELGQVISELQPYAWIFGYSHRNVSNFYIGKTQMRTNQLG
jgi:hypothetical protein